MISFYMDFIILILIKQDSHFLRKPRRNYRHSRISMGLRPIDYIMRQIFKCVIDLELLNRQGHLYQ